MSDIKKDVVLAPCPFCGCFERLKPRFGDSIQHPFNDQDEDCPLKGKLFTLKEWNSRPSPEMIDPSNPYSPHKSYNQPPLRDWKKETEEAKNHFKPDIEKILEELDRDFKENFCTEHMNNDKACTWCALARYGNNLNDVFKSFIRKHFGRE